MTRLGGRIFAKPVAALYAVAQHRLSRPLASWARLFLVARCTWDPLPNSFVGVLAGRFAPYLEESSSRSSLDFDASLGFPGEGPYIDFCHRVSAWWPFLLFDFSWLGPKPPGACKCPSDCCSFGLQLLLFSFSCGLTKPRGEAPAFRFNPGLLRGLADVLVSPHVAPDFDSSLGFPGEGWFSFRGFRDFRVFRVLSSSLCLLNAMGTSAPRTPADCERAFRRQPVELVADRVVRPQTRWNRARLLEDFDQWLQLSRSST